MVKPQFNVRVYAIIKQDQKYLISHEWNEKVEFWKFPGGGVEAGEGIVDALKREVSEELKTYPRKAELFYVNEHYQKSKFGPETLLSFYYTVELDKPDLTAKVETKWGKNYHLEFMWVSLDELRNKVHFPLDQKVVKLLSH